MVARVSVVSVVQAVTDDLRNRILAGEILPGAPLSEAEIADWYDVARPTGKAAIEALVRQGLLERKVHKTARVIRLEPNDARDIYRARAIIEAEVVRLLAAEGQVPEAARAANEEIVALADASPRDVVGPDMRFHRSLVDAISSQRTSEMYEALASEVAFCMSQVQGASLLPTELIAHEHALILDLIEEGDGEGAASLLTEHLERARELLAERLAT